MRPTVGSWIPSSWPAYRPTDEFAPGSLLFRSATPHKPGNFEFAVRLAHPWTVYILTSWMSSHFKFGYVPPVNLKEPVWGIPADARGPVILDVDIGGQLTESPDRYRSDVAGFVSLGRKGLLLHGFTTNGVDPSKDGELVISPETWSVVELTAQDHPSTFTRAWQLRLQVTNDRDVIFEPWNTLRPT